MMAMRSSVAAGAARMALPCVVGALAALPAWAQDRSFACVSGDAAACTAVESQLAVNLLEVDATTALFTFSVNGATPMVLDTVDFLGSASALFQPGMLLTGSPNLSGRKQDDVLFVATSAWTARAAKPVPHNGVSPGEWLGVQFNLAAGTTFADVLGSLDRGQLQLGATVRNVPGSAGDVSLLSVIPVPEAPSGLYLMAGLGLMLPWMSRRVRPRKHAG